jgi:hypothetical protein
LISHRQAYLGKVVYFDGLLQRNIINDLDLTLMVAGSQHQGYFFLDAESLTMAKAFDALLRYKSLVNPKIAERYSVYIEVLDDPRIITFGGSAVMGLMGKLVAIAQGQEEVFVDARLAADQDLAFAGEIETRVEPVCALEATDAPEETIKCMVDAIKQGDEDTWRSLFADWRITPLRHGLPPLYDPEYHVRPSILLRAWEHSRRFITSDVYDARINRVSSIKVVHRQGTGDSIPTIEEAMVVLDHVGLIDDEFRTFVNLNVRRVWRLQSQDAGPWKITDIDHL